MLNLGRHSGKNCPNIILHPTLTDRVLEGIAVLLCLLMWIAAVYLYKYQPVEDLETIPVLYRAAIGTVGMIIVAWGGYLPIRFINFPFRLTERNQIVQYRLASRFSRVLTICIGVISIFMVLIGNEPLFGLAEEFFGVCSNAAFVFMVICMAGYYWAAFRNK